MLYVVLNVKRYGVYNDFVSVLGGTFAPLYLKYSVARRPLKCLASEISPILRLNCRILAHASTTSVEGCY